MSSAALSSNTASDVTGKGKAETALLKSNITDQLNRLLTQLEDLEELKDEFTAAEYAETKEETLSQLRDFQLFLEKSLSGDLTLIDEFGSAQLAIQAAISSAFKTPEVIRLFAQKQPDQLRVRLAQLQRDYKIKQINKEQFIQSSIEILVAIKKLGTDLTPEESNFLAEYASNPALAQLESAVQLNVSDEQQQQIMKQASQQVKKAAK